MDNLDLLRLWGKTDRSDPANYHPLLFHLLDVAACAALLWDRLPRCLKARMARVLGLTEDQARSLVALLAGLHDLGKACPGFQSKATFAADLAANGFDFPSVLRKPPHNFVSVPEVMRLFGEWEVVSAKSQPEILRLLAYALGAHHGIFPLTHKIPSGELGERPIWLEGRNALAETLRVVVPGASTIALPADRTTIDDLGFAALLAALISIADWFGSSSYFPMRGPQSVAPYIAASRERARTALDTCGWTDAPTAPEPRSFAELFRYLGTEGGAVKPNAMQAQVEALLRESGGPALWMIEEEMGAGKTEAALSIFDHCRVSGLSHGIYIAMPTQATSNAMFARLGTFLQHRNPTAQINLILAHSHATLDGEYLERMEAAERFDGPVYSDDGDGQEGALLVRSWFTHRKQTLLAHYGVGTIDQALMGVLQVRHWFVRLFGLAGKVVVFDEVHAYDAYMNRLLERLVEWLAELDCTVVLLSATLPKTTRLGLADAYARGARASLSRPENQAAYPRLTLVKKAQAASARAVHVPDSPGRPSKSVRLDHAPNSPESVKAAILDAIPGDGCAIVICNTVASAQRMYAALRAELEPLGWNCRLFHARTPFVWRKETEEFTLANFGKSSGENGKRPRCKTLLVATQVAEQSLDLDADFMASELAPIDLLLQRMGRLYRHLNRARTSTGPRFALLYDTDDAGLPELGPSGKVYAPYILLRTWLPLRGMESIELPAQIEPLVAAVYDDPEPGGLPTELSGALADARRKLIHEQTEQKNHAGGVSVPLPTSEGNFVDWVEKLTAPLLEDEGPETHPSLLALTRDGDPSVIAVLCGTGENFLPLAPDPAGRIPPEVVQKMMGFSVSLSHPALFQALKREQPPANWKRNAHLKHCRRIVFDNGASNLAGYALTLTLALGLKIARIPSA